MMEKLKIIFLVGCAKEQEAPTKQDEVVPVRVAKVELRDIQESLDYIGNIKAQNEAVVYPKVSGKIIEKLKEDGNEVKKGDVIMYIDRDEVGFKFENAPVESPLEGVVGRIYVDIGANVTAQTPVALIVSMDNVKIDLRRLRERQVPERADRRLPILLPAGRRQSRPRHRREAKRR